MAITMPRITRILLIFRTEKREILWKKTLNSGKKKMGFIQVRGPTHVYPCTVTLSERTERKKNRIGSNQVQTLICRRLERIGSIFFERFYE